MAKKAVASDKTKTSKSKPARKSKATARPNNAHAQVDRIIGIGSSAGGLEAIRELATNLPLDLGCSYVVVQHMSPQHKSLMTTLIASETKLKVLDAKTGVTPEANVIYVTPPNTDIIIENNRLKLVEPSEDVGKPKPSVDRFLVSLAQDRGENSMGVILSGTGSDGAYGVQAIREAGGITIAQDDASAKYDGMANSAIETGCIDLILRPSEIGTHLSKIISSAGDLEQFRNTEDMNSPLSGILQIVLARTRVDFREYKQTTVQRRIERRMVALGIAQIEDYVVHCRNSPNEVDALFKDLLISVTRFFRDGPEFDALRKPIQELVDNRGDKPLRIWVAGCATGEEVYSIAMLIADAMGGPSELVKSRTQIFATDIDTAALAVARRGHYPNAALLDVPKNFQKTYFVQQSDGVRVIEALRAAILFSDHNLCQDPPFLNMDLICCRNLLIYFGAKLQSRVLSRLHYALKPSGYMFLGTAETAIGADQLFANVEDSGHIYKRRQVHGRSKMDMRSLSRDWSKSKSSNSSSGPVTPTLHSNDRVMFAALARSISDNAVLVSTEYSFLRVYGDITEFVDISEGAPLDLQLSVLRSPLREEGRSLVTLALKHGERRVGSRHRWRQDKILRLDAIPIQAPGIEEKMALLAFNIWDQDHAATQSDERQQSDLSGDYLRELDMELANTREALQQTIEELETSNEELQALNEELQSTNEELQATNEELETSNEELQSTNEELITVNEELQVNSAELMAINAELGSILGNVPMPLLVLDNALQVTRASGAAIDMFKIATPLKFPHLSQIALPFGFPNLVDMCNDALRLGKAQQLEFEAEGKSYALQCAPFSGESGQLIGTTLVFTNVPALRSLAGEISDLLEHAPFHLIRYGTDGVVSRISLRTAEALGIKTEDAIGQKIDDLLRYSVDPETGDRISEIVNSKSNRAVFAMRKQQNADPIWVSCERYVYKDSGTGARSFILSGTDVTQIVEAERDTGHKNKWLTITQDIAGIGYWHIDIARDEVYWSDKVYEIHGLDPKIFRPSLQSGIEAYHEDDRETVRNAVEEAIRNKKDFRFRCRLERPNKQLIWVESRGEVLTDQAGEPEMVLGMFRDVSDQVEQEMLLKRFDRLQTEDEVGFFSFDVLTERAYWSSNMAKILGVPDGATPAYTTFRDIIVPEDREKFIRLRSDALKKQESVNADFRVQTGKSPERVLNLRFFVGDVRDGQVVNYFGEIRPVD